MGNSWQDLPGLPAQNCPQLVWRKENEFLPNCHFGGRLKRRTSIRREQKSIPRISWFFFSHQTPGRYELTIIKGSLTPIFYSRGFKTWERKECQDKFGRDAFRPPPFWPYFPAKKRKPIFPFSFLHLIVQSNLTRHSWNGWHIRNSFPKFFSLRPVSELSDIWPWGLIPIREISWRKARSGYGPG